LKVVEAVVGARVGVWSLFPGDTGADHYTGSSKLKLRVHFKVQKARELTTIKFDHNLFIRGNKASFQGSILIQCRPQYGGGRISHMVALALLNSIVGTAKATVGQIAIAAKMKKKKNTAIAGKVLIKKKNDHGRPLQNTEQHSAS